MDAGTGFLDPQSRPAGGRRIQPAQSRRCLLYTSTKLGQIDYAAEIAQIRAAKPDAVYIFLPGGMGLNFVKQFVSAGLSQSVKLIGPGFSADEDVILSLIHI